MHGVPLPAGQSPRAPFTPAASIVRLLVQVMLSGMKSSLTMLVSFCAFKSYLCTSLAVHALKYMERPSELTSTPLGYPARVPGNSASPLPGVHRETYPLTIPLKRSGAGAFAWAFACVVGPCCWSAVGWVAI